MYKAKEERYSAMPYRRCGKSGLLLPALSLGLWHNFGSVDDYANSKAILECAFDHGITHFDLANNYGPVAGSAETTLGRVLKDALHPYRDELIISTKAGYGMWPGPYGDWGSKKYLFASIDQSLRRLGLDYVDIFYHHRPDPHTPLEETILALDLLVKQGKALYIGISNYNAEESLAAVKLLSELKTPFVLHQMRYNLMERWAEEGLLSLLASAGIGAIAYSPLAQGLLTERYLDGIPQDSRMAREEFLKSERLTEDYLKGINQLKQIADERGQSVAQLSIAWLLRNEGISSVLVGASSTAQLKDNIKALEALSFSQEELDAIDAIAW